MAKKKRTIKIQKGIPPMILFLMVTFLIIVIGSLLVPVYYPIDLSKTDLALRLKKPFWIDPTSQYIFGTDALGRDLLIRIIYGTRETILISFTGMLLATGIGLILGILSGMCGGWVDMVISFLNDARLSVSTTFIGIILACILGATPGTIILVIAITGWSSFCRLVRGQIIQLRNASFIESSRAMGASGIRIIWEHVLINIASPLIVQATMSLSNFILLESTLSFLGLGIQPPQPSLGLLISEGREVMITNWWMAILPSVVLIMLILQISLTGDWLRDKLDPKMKNNS